TNGLLNADRTPKIPLEQIGVGFGISRERVRQLIASDPRKAQLDAGEISSLDPMKLVAEIRSNPKIRGYESIPEASTDDARECIKQLGMEEEIARLFRMRKSVQERKLHGVRVSKLKRWMTELATELGHVPSSGEIMKLRPGLFSLIHNSLEINISQARALAGLGEADLRVLANRNSRKGLKGANAPLPSHLKTASE
ncbi:MAG: hypothetical protein V4465_00225, partial [Patescibacteria group bacterium]